MNNACAKSIAALFLGLLSMRASDAQTGSPAPGDVDSGKVQPLDLTPGCWDVSIHVSEEGFAGPTLTIVEAREKVLASIPANQRDKVPPEQVEQAAQGLVETQKLMDKAGKTGSNGRSLFCTNAPFASVGIDLFGTPNSDMQCSRSVEVAGAERHFRSSCALPPDKPVKNDQVYRIVNDYVRVDARNFHGSQQKVSRIDAQRSAYAVTTSMNGKWTGELSAHPPHSPAETDLDGKRPIGVKAVAYRDPFRIVAQLGKENYTAVRAYILLHFVSAETARKYGPRVQDVLHRIYQQAVVVHEAGLLKLAAQQPWTDKLQHSGYALGALGTSYSALDVPMTNAMSPWDFKTQWRVAYSLFTPIATLERNTGIVTMNQPAYTTLVDIIWEAYFAQAKNEAEKQALYANIESKSGLTIVDPDFFAEVAAPETGAR